MVAFNSKVSALEPILGDTISYRVQQFTLGDTDPRNYGRGRYPRNYYTHPFGAPCQPLSLPLVPRSEWIDRIEQMEKDKSRLSDLILDEGIPEKDQNGTNFCWMFGPVQCVEVTRVLHGMPYESLSPASLACKITNFRNIGGWGTEAMAEIIAQGLVPSSKWPDIAIDRRYDTPENDLLRDRYKVLEWWDLPPRSLDALATCCFHRIPTAVGFDHWSHEVMACDVVYYQGKFGIRIRNQWKNWGDRNFGLLLESKAVPDDAIAPRFIIPALAA